MRDMAKKPPSVVESMPVFQANTITNSLQPLMRIYEPFQSRTRAEKPVQPYIEIQKKNNDVAPTPIKTPQRQPTWEPLDAIKKKTQVAPPPVKQLPLPTNPQVTVLIDVKDNADFTEALLQSIVRQTYTKWTGLIGLRTNDDLVSKALTESIVKLQLSNLVKVVELKGSLSLSDSYKSLLSRVNTPYVAFAKNTDLWVSKKLEKQLELLEKDSSIGVLGTMSRFFGDKLELADVPPGLLNISDFITNNPIVFSSVLVKKELVDFTNEFTNFDYECWSKLVKNNVKMSNATEILTLQRVHSSIMTNTNDDKEIIRKKLGL